MMRSLRARAITQIDRQTDRQTDSPRMRPWGSRHTEMMRSLRARAVKQTDRLTSDETMGQQTHTDDEVTQSQGYETDRQTDRRTLTSDETMGQQTDTDDEATQSQGYHTDRQTNRQTDSPLMRPWGSRQTQMMRSLRARAITQTYRQTDSPLMRP